jgi:hypothetical protein
MLLVALTLGRALALRAVRCGASVLLIAVGRRCSLVHGRVVLI